VDKINAVLVLLNREALDRTLKKLNLDNVDIVTIVADGDPDEKVFTVDDKKILRTPFSAVPDVAEKYRDFIWLVGGYLNGSDDLIKTKKFLMIFGVPEDNIVNLEVISQISGKWFANLRYIEKHGADFFATGNEYMRDGLDMNYIPRISSDKSLGGVNLADANQDLRQSYLTAKHVFAHTKPGTIKFVLIGLSPYSFRYDNEQDFSNQKNLQYLFDWKSGSEDGYDNLIGTTPFEFLHLCRFKVEIEENTDAESAYDRLLKNLLSDDAKKVFETPSAQADLNFDGIKAELDRDFSYESIADWKDDVKFVTTADVKKNVQILKDYIELCLDNGAKPIGVIFPCAPTKRKTYNKKFLESFRKTIAQLENSYDFTCLDLFERLNYNCFCDMNHLNLKGNFVLNTLISFNLCKKGLIPVRSFCDMDYDYFYQLSWLIPKDDYNDFMAHVFNASAQMIRRKEKIKIAFVLYDTSIWCGDDLYNLFTRDERFETSILFCMRANKLEDEAAKKDFLQGVEQFKSHGLNVIAVEEWNSDTPVQDVLIFLTPYFAALSKEPLTKMFTPKTLMTYVPYALDVIKFNFFKYPIYHVSWKLFFYSAMSVREYDKNCYVGMPRGFYSGHPKIDSFFTGNANFSFFWKIARANTKKIIWAPHWSISEGIMNSTFQWNYKFMYEFAKAHPEISWVVKPHPNLFFSTVKEGIFPSVEAFEEYLQKWNDLPNAQVYLGAYYQAIFATSDGMIHDSSSFVAEYQYVDKPMIYLTRGTQKFYELGEKILKVSYLVNGKDFEAIAALIQKVFIDGNDDKAAERKEVFDKYLNYTKFNGMLASEFVYRKIADELRGSSTLVY
jgi:hypothetical protein